VRILASTAVLALTAIACGGSSDSAARGGYVVTVQVDGAGRLLSLPPAIDCPAKCTAVFPAGSWVTLAATSGDGVSFVEWSRGCSGAAGCGFAVTNDVEVLARFETTTAPSTAP
jgi:Divergent InlB B-repeat domain